MNDVQQVIKQQNISPDQAKDIGKTVALAVTTGIMVYVAGYIKGRDQAKLKHILESHNSNTGSRVVVTVNNLEKSE